MQKDNEKSQIISQKVREILSEHNVKLSNCISCDVDINNREVRIILNRIISNSCVSKLRDVLGKDFEYSITIAAKANRQQVQGDLKGLNNIKNIIGVGSAKGGVGKSTTTLGVAREFAKFGFKVGILDADIYGPSMPIMMGLEPENRSPSVDDTGKMIPLEKDGVKMISMGHLVEDTAPIVWRGPMVSGALMQLLEKTAWQELDYLFIDLPPGTGDILLSSCQKIPLTGVLLVTTPQTVAWRDTLKSASMFKKMHVEILGVAENMSIFRCPNCEHEMEIFGSGGANILAELFDIKVLATIPYDENLHQCQNNGEHASLEEFKNLAIELSMLLSEKSLLKPVPITSVKIL